MNIVLATSLRLGKCAVSHLTMLREGNATCDVRVGLEAVERRREFLEAIPYL